MQLTSLMWLPPPIWFQCTFPLCASYKAFFRNNIHGRIISAKGDLISEQSQHMVERTSLIFYIDVQNLI